MGFRLVAPVVVAAVFLSGKKAQAGGLMGIKGDRDE